MRGRVVLAAGLVAVWPIACGLTADFSGLQGGTRTTPDADAATPLDATTEAASDATVESGILDDAGDSGRSFCASLTTPVMLCTDFDEGEPVDDGWGATDLSAGGEAISVSATAFSPPGSFLSAINPSDAPASARLLETVTPTSSPHVHVEFEMLLTPSDGTFELAVIHEVTSDGTTYGLYFREVNSALQVELRSLSDDGGLYDQTWPIGPPPASWTHVILDMDVADSGSFTVQEGAIVVTETNQPTSTDSRTAMFVELGFYSFTPATGQANFDNVIVDWAP